MDGRIELSDVPDGGARFEVRLPEAVGVVEAPPEEHAVGAAYSDAQGRGGSE
jgi:hypothetical protein